MGKIFQGVATPLQGHCLGSRRPCKRPPILGDLVFCPEILSTAALIAEASVGVPIWRLGVMAHGSLLI